MKSKEVTIYDIAEELSLSAASVSRGLKGHPSISQKTKKKILAKAKELGYRSNNFASNLRKKHTNTIGILIPELNSAFMVSVLSGIEKIISATDYDIIIAHSAESGKREVANANNLFHKRVDGLICSLAFDTPNLSHFDQFFDKGIPVVFFDRVEESSRGAKIIIDNYKAAYEVTQHLIAQGCKRIAHLTKDLTRNVYLKRFEGYRQALQDHDIEFKKEWLVMTNLRDEAGLAAAAQGLMSLKHPPDGLFASNDFSAVLCMKTFKEGGLSIPGDIAVAGFNNEAISRIIEPELTTVNYSGTGIGEMAARVLLSHLKGNIDIALTHSVVMNTELIIRASTLRKPA